jgi:hypothetical protein
MKKNSKTGINTDVEKNVIMLYNDNVYYINVKPSPQPTKSVKFIIDVTHEGRKIDFDLAPYMPNTETLKKVLWYATHQDEKYDNVFAMKKDTDKMTTVGINYKSAI